MDLSFEGGIAAQQQQLVEALGEAVGVGEARGVVGVTSRRLRSRWDRDGVREPLHAEAKTGNTQHE